jgi:ribonuclease Z
LRVTRTVLATLLAIGLTLFLARTWVFDFVIERVSLAVLPDRSVLEDDALHLHLCGTGLPAMDPTAGSACSAIVAGAEVLMIDAGAGGLQQLTVDRVPIEELSTILITHFHSDHIGGLGDAINLSAFRGRERRLTVYGPPGVEEVVAGFVAAYASDSRLKSHPEGGFIDPKWTRPDVRVVEVSGDNAALVFDRSGLRVTAFAVDHHPVERAYGYRVDYRGRSIAFSGDTRGDPRLAGHAKGVDILVHSAMGLGFIAQRVVPILERYGMTRDAKLTAEAQRIFAPPVEVAMTAQAASAKRLVFSHKPPVPWVGEFVYLWGVSDVYDGEVTVGRDGMRFDLPVASSPARTVR